MLTRRLPALLISTALLLLPAVLYAQENNTGAPPAPAADQTGTPPTAAADQAGTPSVQDADEESAPTRTVKEKQPDPNPALQAPTINGLTGLFRLVTGDIGRPHTFRLGLHTEMFNSSDFLVMGDDHSRFIGTLSGSYTPWQFLEFFVNFKSMANDNERSPEKDRTDEPVILALGDFSFGAKGQYPVLPYLSMGANFGLTFMNSVGGVSLDGGATSFYIGMLTSFRLDTLANFPFGIHLNAGYQLDNSNNLVSLANQTLPSMVVNKFSYGINPSSFQLKFGLDMPLRRWVGFGLTPIIELAANITTDDRDPDFNMSKFAKPAGLLDPSEFDGASTVWMTFGVRVNPVAGLNIDLAVDKGIASPGYSYGSPVVPWNVILGLSYAYDPAPPVRVIKTVEIKTEVKEVDKKPIAGKLRGRVINAETMEPVEGAIVTFPGKDFTGLSTDPDGSFLTYELPVGSHPIMVRHPDYQPAKLKTDIGANVVKGQDIKLVPAAPKVGKISGSITDNKGKPVAATLELAGPENRQATADEDGTFGVEVKPGNYSLQASAQGYLRKVQKLTIKSGENLQVVFSLSKKPRRSLVRVTKKAIQIKRQVHFATGTATIKPDSQQLMDEVVDVLLRQANITRVEIGGHTDNRGGAAFNLKLSRARAEAVREYLIQNGVASDRLEAKGYGADKPKVPNITARNRARNRRVEFLILSQL